MGSFLPAYQMSIDNQVLQIQGEKNSLESHRDQGTGVRDVGYLTECLPITHKVLGSRPDTT